MIKQLKFALIILLFAELLPSASALAQSAKNSPKELINKTKVQSKLKDASNLAQDIKNLPKPGVLIVLYSRGQCPYCEKVRKNNLLPLLNNSEYTNIELRQINIDSDDKLIDFTGKTTNHSEFAKANKISLVPVVVFYGHQGQSVSKPLVGALLDDFYQAYLDAAIKESLTARD